MVYDFSGKRILVTGAGAGIGRGIALYLAQLGGKVFALSKVQEELDTLKQENDSIETLCIDLTDWDKTREAVKSVLPIHHLVNNAAIASRMPFLQATPEQFDAIYNTNLKAVLNVTQVVANDLIEIKLAGTIVHISSVTAHVGIPDFCIYASAKAAVDSFTRSMAKELGPYNIRVNSVAPTTTKTELAKPDWSSPDFCEKLFARASLPKLAEIQDVVNAVTFLLSDQSAMTTGSTLLVDGGYVNS